MVADEEGEGGKGVGEEVVEEAVEAEAGSVEGVGGRNLGDRVGGGRWTRRETWALCSFLPCYLTVVYHDVDGRLIECFSRPPSVCRRPVSRTDELACKTLISWTSLLPLENVKE